MSKFPTENERARSAEIKKNKLLYKGKFQSVLPFFTEASSTVRQNRREPIVNLTGMATDIFADFMFRNSPEVNSPEEYLKEIIDIFTNSKLATKLWSAAVGQSYGGFTALEVRIKNGSAFIDVLQPENVFPRYGDDGELESVRVVTVSEVGGLPVLKIKKHTIGEIEYSVQYYGGKLDGQMTNPRTLWNVEGITNLRESTENEIVEIEDTGLNQIPVFLVQNKDIDGNLGVSDYDDLISILDEYTSLNSQISTQLKKHANSKIAVPEGTLDEKGRMKDSQDVFEVTTATDGEQMIVPQYITNSNPQLDQAIKNRQDVLSDFSRVSQVALELIDAAQRGGVEKVGALRTRIFKTLAKVDRKLKAFTPAITGALALAYNWQTAEGSTVVSADEISVNYKSGLPVDEVEQTTIQVQRIGAGIQTTKDAIRTLDGLEGDALAQKVQEIDEAARSALGVSVTPAPTVTL